MIGITRMGGILSGGVIGSITPYTTPVSPWFANGNGSDDILALFGAAPTEWYDTGGVSSGNITGKIVGNVLTAVTSPLYEQTYINSTLGAGFDDGTYDSFDAADTGVHNVTTGAIAILVPVLRNTDIVRGIMGKYSNTAGLGYRLGVVGAPEDNKLQWVLEGSGAGTNRFLSVPEDLPLSAQAVLCWRSAVSQTCGITSTWGTEDSNTFASTLNMSNGGKFALGSYDTTRAMGSVVGPTVIWEGAAAETVITSRVANLAAWWVLASA